MRFFLLCIFMTMGLFLNAQVKVTVVNQSNEPLVGATVAYNKTGTTTNANGIAMLSSIKEGTLVSVRYIGFKPIQKRYTGEAMQFVLSEDISLLEEVLVTTQLPRVTAKTPVTFSTISKELLSEQNLGEDIPMLLQGSPSVVSSSDAGTGIGYTAFRVRGTDANRINITLNGVPLNDSESHSVFWVNVPDIASTTKEVQIQRGVGTSSNGVAAFGASLNIQTDDYTEKPYGQVAISGGSFGTFRQNYAIGTGLLNNRLSLDAKFSDIRSDGYVDRAFSDLESYYASATYKGNDFLLKLLTFSGKEQTYQAWSGVPSEKIKTNRTYNPEGEYKDDNGNTRYYDNHTDNYKQTHYQLFYSQKLAESFMLNTTLHYTQGEGYYESYKTGRKYANYGLQVPVLSDGTKVKKTEVIQQKWLDNDFYGIVSSLQYKKDKWEMFLGLGLNRYAGDHFGDVIWDKKGHFPLNYRWYSNNASKNEFYTYLKAYYQLTPTLNLFGDVQLRKINYKIAGKDDDLRNIGQAHDFNFFNPKVGLTYMPSTNVRAFLSWARANREPNRSNFTDANPTQGAPRYETLDDFEMGVSYQKPSWFFATNLYYMLYNDQLVLTGAINDVGSSIMTNIPDSYRMGIELEGGWKLSDKFQWYANATFSKNEARNFVAFVDDWDNWGQQITNTIGTTNLAYSPDIVANTRLTYSPAKDLDFTFNSSYVDKQYLDNTSSENRKLDSYVVSNIRINYAIRPNKLVKEIAFNLHFNNIFNEKYETNGWVYRYVSGGKEGKLDGLFPQATFNVMGGISIKF